MSCAHGQFTVVTVVVITIVLIYFISKYIMKNYDINEDNDIRDD